jgi:hypothetical protein
MYLPMTLYKIKMSNKKYKHLKQEKEIFEDTLTVSGSVNG